MLIQRVAPTSQLRIWSDSDRLFAIIDACDEPSVPREGDRRGEEVFRSLYRGRADADLWAIAPYLVKVDTELLDWISTDLWSRPWGIFASSMADFETLYTHFRQFLVVDGPEGEPWYFRFYDPRVLPKYLSTAPEADRARFFGPVSAYLVGAGATNVTVLTTGLTGGFAVPSSGPSTPIVRR